MTPWREATFLAWEEQKGLCAICGNRIFLNISKGGQRIVGHHIINRCKGRIDTVDNCEARHQDCEVWAHQRWKDGNPK